MTQKLGAKCDLKSKYSNFVRVVSIGESVSKELCGGTHVTSTASIFPFCILSEGSISAGTRRIEAVAGVSAVAELMKKREELLQIDRALPSGVVGTTLDRSVQCLEKMHQLEKLSKVCAVTHPKLLVKLFILGGY